MKNGIETKTTTMRASQNSMILKHLRKGRTITSLQAWKSFGCSALHSRAADLRKMGVDLKGKWVLVKTAYGIKRVMRYWVEEDG